MDYRELLNERQYDAVAIDSQFTRVVAGAGSGKTRVLTYRLAYLVGERNVDPWTIVAIAFTNKVAAEMKSRVAKVLGSDRGISVSTFHSFCAKFLRREIDNIGFPNNFTILDEEDQTTLIKNIGVDMGYKRNDDMVKRAISYIGYYKCAGIAPDDVQIDKNSSDAEKKCLQFYHKYEERKDQMLSLDFDDLLLKAIYILEHFPEVRQRWQERITNILVDEFQDTNDVQYHLLKLLMNERTSLYVVGDPDQTIYTWRGANQDIILNFKKDFPMAETVILDRNYRSTKKILDCANRLIAHNKKRVPKDLYTENNDGDDIVLKGFMRNNDEAKYVAEEIQQLHRKGVPYRDIAILYRAAYLTLPFENEFMTKRLPYQIYGGLKFFQRKEIKDMLAYFKLICNVKDDISFERIVNVPRRGIGDSSLSILKSEKNALGMSYIEYLNVIEKHETELKPKVVMALTFMIQKMNETKKRLDQALETYPQVLEDFIRELGYYDYLKSDDETAEERLQNVKALFQNITQFLKDNPESRFDDYLENAALQSAQDELKDTDVVSLMTVHVAKGLEFKYVFVIGLQDGVFPSQRAVDESGHNGKEEERRLCYVAFTRAREKLYVTYNTGYSFTLGENPRQSCFINEAGLRSSYKPYQTQNSIYRSNGSFGFYADKPSPMYESQKPVDNTPKTNGITDWHVGDVAIHEVFGRGLVIEIIDQTILVILFEEHGRKTIMSTHPKVRKEEKGGAEA